MIAKCLQKIPKRQRICRVLRIIIQNMLIYNLARYNIQLLISSLNNGLKCRKPVFMRASGIYFIKWLQFGSICEWSNVQLLQSKCRQPQLRTAGRHLTRMNMREDMLTLSKSTILSNQNRTGFQNSLIESTEGVVQEIHSCIGKAGYFDRRIR